MQRVWITCECRTDGGFYVFIDAFATNQTGRNARLDDPLEHTTDNISLAEALVAGARERRMIRDSILDTELAEPAIGEVHLHFTTGMSNYLAQNRLAFGLDRSVAVVTWAAKRLRRRSPSRLRRLSFAQEIRRDRLEHIEHMRKHGLRVTHARDVAEFSVPVRALHVTDAQQLAKEKPVDIAFVCMSRPRPPAPYSQHRAVSTSAALTKWSSALTIPRF